ncbi:hypothetical protein AGR2A_pa40008 [Agrobacterium genomosp. 2 str. CFBP 5494]|uniref:Uncharacterized protein n=1 Tax=Agrobacterium genomosp. 2 str. CFBP 5494 TaxID=1183436 RepID=A0A9W5B728_9HYPH|nr:hypothetical protein AGR2A_pa40008 [Agrobacterium genomosp. 2 str. CFBP 5494]
MHRDYRRSRFATHFNDCYDIHQVSIEVQRLRWTSNAASGCGVRVKFAQNFGRQGFGDLREVASSMGITALVNSAYIHLQKSRDEIGSLSSGITNPDPPQWPEALCGACFLASTLGFSLRATHATVVKDRNGSCSLSESLFSFSCSVIQSSG